MAMSHWLHHSAQNQALTRPDWQIPDCCLWQLLEFPLLSLSRFLFLLFFALKEQLEPFVVSLGEIVTPSPSLGTLGTPMLFMSTLIDASV